jgi:hypothetical protein
MRLRSSGDHDKLRIMADGGLRERRSEMTDMVPPASARAPQGWLGIWHDAKLS